MRIILFSAFLISFYSHAQGIDTLKLSEIDSRISLKNKSYYLVRSSEVGIDSIVSTLHYSKQLNPLNKINFGYNNHIYWLIVPVKANKAEKENFLLELQNPHFDRLQAWCLTHNGLTLLDKETGDDLPFKSRSYIHRNFIWNISECGTEEFSVIIRIEKRHSAMKLPAYIWTLNEHNAFYDREDLILGLAYGMMMLVGIYSLIAGLFLKRKIYFTYTAFIIMAILLLATHKGLSFQLLYPNWGGFNSIFNVATTRLVTFFLIIFSQQFLRTKLHTPILHKLLNYVVLIYLLTIIGTPFLLDFYIRHSLIMLPLMLAINFAGNILCLLAAILSFRKQKSIASFYLVAYLAAHFSGMITIIQEFGWIEDIIFDALLISAVVEVLVFSFGLTYMIKKIYDERNELSMKIVKQQKDSLNAYVQGVEKERERIAGELHDDIGSRLGNLRRMLSSTNVQTDYLEKQIDALTEDVRNISHQLSPAATSIKGLIQMVIGLIHDTGKSSSIKIQFQHYDVPENLPADIAQQAYRIIQEGINNIIKHANASEADIQIFGHEHELVLTIEDNGKGFDISNNRAGIGLNQMKSRTEMLEGQFEINSMPGKGTQIMVSLPI